MKYENLKRRDFSKWTVAAFGGFVSGSLIGCEAQPTSAPPAKVSGTPPAGGEVTSNHEAHACRGLNSCKSASNECRGQGSCATEAWHHMCGGKNECRGQGGCGSAPLTNTCKGEGGCHIPLMDAAWETARKNMEAKWTENKEQFGPAPAKKS